MPVINFDELQEGRTLTRGVDNTTASKTFRAETDDDFFDEWDVGSDPLVPKVGDLYPNSALLRVQSVAITQDGDARRFWIVTVTYSTTVPEDPDETEPDPLARPPEVSINQIRSTEPVQSLPDYFNRDTNANTIAAVNSAGIPYDPPIEREVVDLAIVVTQNLAELDPDQVNGYKGSVNSEVFEIYDPGQCRIVDLSYQQVTENGITFYRRTVEIHVREKTPDYSWPDVYPWQAILPNFGFQQKTAPGNELEKCVDQDGNQVTEPAPLDESGRQQNQDLDPTFKRYDLYPAADFADLDLRFR